MILITPLALLIFLVVILRIPSLFEPYWYGDEGIYLTLGQAVRQGLVLYRDIFDHKPPLLYWFAALAGSVFWFRLILLVWHAGTVFLFSKLSSKLFDKNSRLVVFSTGFFALFTTIPMLEGNIANAEIFMIGTTIAALNLIFPIQRLTTKRIFYTGILFSLSFLFKVPAVFDFVAVVFFWFAWALGLKNTATTFKRGFIASLAFLIFPLLTVIYYGARGGLVDYLNTAGLFNSSYIANWETPAKAVTSEVLSGGFQTRALVLSFSLVLLMIFRKRFDQTTFFVTSWLFFATFGALLSGRPYPHYIIQVIPPLALAAGILFFSRQSKRFLVVPALLIFLTSLVFYKFYTYPTFSYYQNFVSFVLKQKDAGEYRAYFGSHVNRTYRLANILAARTTKRDKIFIWGTNPELYALTRRIPPTKYTVSFHIKDLRAEGETMEVLSRTRPKYIVKLLDTKETLPGLDSFLLQNYIFVEDTEGAQLWKSMGPRISNYLR